MFQLYTPDFKRFPLNDYIVPIVQTIASQYWLQKVYLAVDIEVWWYWKLRYKWIVHCVSLPALLILPCIKRVCCCVLLYLWVSMGQISIIVFTLVTMMSARLFNKWIIWYWRLSQLKLCLITAIFHQTTLNSFHLSHAGRYCILICQNALVSSLQENLLIRRL